MFYYTTMTSLLLGLLHCLLDLSVPLGQRVGGDGLASLLGDNSGLGGNVLSGQELGVLLSNGGIGIKLQHGADVLQRVGLGLLGLNNRPLGGPKDLPDLLRLEQLGQISVGHLRHGQIPALLGLGALAPCAIQTI